MSRVLNLATMRDNRERAGEGTFELIACIDGRGFRVRREDMRKILVATKGKVFTLATLDRLVECTVYRFLRGRSADAHGRTRRGAASEPRLRPRAGAPIVQGRTAIDRRDAAR